MNQNLTVIITAVLVAVLAIVGGAVLLLRPANPAATTPVQQQESPSTSYTNTNTVSTVPQAMRTKEAIRAAFKAQLPPGDHTQLGNTSIVGDYAIQAWVNEPMGGEALLKYDATQGQWVIVVNTGGAFGVAELRNEGVPQKTVLALLDGLRP